eukprot:scaffold1566_cov185-Ochromonas_danica.AAC.2
MTVTGWQSILWRARRMGKVTEWSPPRASGRRSSRRIASRRGWISSLITRESGWEGVRSP